MTAVQLKAVTYTRRSICAHHCPLPGRCEKWTVSSGAMVEDPAAQCPAGAWHELNRSPENLAKLSRPLSPAPKPVAAPDGPGTILKRMLLALGIKAAGNCACNRRAAEMDARGPEWCAENLRTIVGWLREEAKRRELPFNGAAARLLVLLAVWRARRARKKRTL